jgi:hypothetical protein
LACATIKALARIIPCGNARFPAAILAPLDITLVVAAFGFHELLSLFESAVNILVQRYDRHTTGATNLDAGKLLSHDQVIHSGATKAERHGRFIHAQQDF